MIATVPGHDGSVVDACFSEPRLAAIYDVLDGERSDLNLYEAVASEVEASSMLDIGCGTGTLACRLASRGLKVTAVDPAEASVALARTKPAADRVRWIVGDVSAFDGPTVDLVTMTGNVAQVFLSDEEWTANLQGCRAALQPSGWLVFEARDPEREAWRDWTPERTYKRLLAPGAGRVDAWCELTDVRPPLVSFRWTYVFEADGAVLTSDSTLRFRSRRALGETLEASGFVARGVCDAPDRPGLELVLFAQPEA